MACNGVAGGRTDVHEEMTEDVPGESGDPYSESGLDTIIDQAMDIPTDDSFDASTDRIADDGGSDEPAEPGGCGDGMIDPGEYCDGENLNGETCESLGYVGGTLTCSEYCNFDPSGCVTCGNGTIDIGEDCDGTDVGGHSCLAHGFPMGGTIDCHTDCTLDLTGCCGNGVLGGSEECDDGNTADWDGCNSCEIAEFRVNSYLILDQEQPDVAMAPDGRAVVVWQSNGQDGDGWGIYAQRFDVAGTRAGSEFRVNTTTGGNQTNPAVAMAADGTFVVVWESEGMDGDRRAVIAQKFSWTGSLLGGEMQVNLTGVGDQHSPEVAMASDTRFVVVYVHESGIRSIRFSYFDASGSRTLSSISLFGADAHYPDVAIADDGDFTAVCGVEVSYTIDIRGYMIDETGTALHSFIANTTTSGDQTSPAIGMAPTGEYIVAWQDENDGSGPGIFAQRFSAGGTKMWGEFLLHATTTGSQRAPELAKAADGRFVAIWWHWDGIDDTIHAQRHDSTGTRTGSEITVNTDTYTFTEYAVAVGDRGRFMVVFGSHYIDSNREGVAAQRYDGTGAALGVLPW